VDANAYPNPLLVEPALRHAVLSLAPDQPLTHVAEMRQVISDRIAPKRLSAQMIACFAGLALLLAALGIYGVLSFSVAQRTHEIGVRMALGAPHAAIIRSVAGEAAALAGIGVAAGIAAAIALSSVLESLLFGVSATEPSVYAGVAAALVATALVAAVLPARRAAKVDPAVALRHE
jgi:putative ABC transport system permease protein